MGSFTEIDLDLSYLDDLEEIIVHDECGGDDVSFYREGLLASESKKLRELFRYAREQLKKAEDELDRDIMASASVVLDIRMRELGIEVPE